MATWNTRLEDLLCLDYIDYKMSHFNAKVIVQDTSAGSSFRRQLRRLRVRFDSFKKVIKTWDHLKDCGGIVVVADSEIDKLAEQKNDILNTLNLLSQRLELHLADIADTSKIFPGIITSQTPQLTLTPLSRRLEDVASPIRTRSLSFVIGSPKNENDSNNVNNDNTLSDIESSEHSFSSQPDKMELSQQSQSGPGADPFQV